MRDAVYINKYGDIKSMILDDHGINFGIWDKIWDLTSGQIFKKKKNKKSKIKILGECLATGPGLRSSPPHLDDNEGV